MKIFLALLTTVAIFLFVSVQVTHAAEHDGQFLGAGSCASSGCHGNAHSRSPETWPRSLNLWATLDPHTRASEVLLNQRSRDIITALAPANSPVVDESPQNYERRYLSSLEQRCVGCHATPPPAETANVQHQLTRNFLTGVSCESCHGAAKPWLAEHTTSRWQKLTASEKQTSWGMRDTSSLFTRAQICLECHVGPLVDGRGQAYEVDHDLIAAGHPRLSFEFSTYLANLPVHWDIEKDKKRAGTKSFHFEAWRMGQFQQARILASQLQQRNNAQTQTNELQSANGRIEFSNYDCFACHQQLRLKKFSPPSQTTLPDKKQKTPHAEDFPFAQLQFLLRRDDTAKLRALSDSLTNARSAMANVWTKSDAADSQKPLSQLPQQFDAATVDFQQLKPSQQDQIDILKDLVSDFEKDPHPTWEATIQLYLAIAAFTADGAAPPSQLHKRQQQLTTILNHCFGNDESPSIFKSPTEFRSRQVEIRRIFANIKMELEQRRF